MSRVPQEAQRRRQVGPGADLSTLDFRKAEGRSWQWRGPAIWLFLAAAGFAVLALLVRQPGAVPSIDAWGHRTGLTHRTPALLMTARVVTQLGSGAVVTPFVAVAMLFLSVAPARQRIGYAVLALVVLGTGSLVRLGLSALITRHRPPATDWAAPAAGYAFPSGHSTASSLAAGVLAWTASKRLSGRHGVRAAVWSVAVGFAVAVGLTRVYLGVHWPTDVLGAWAFATVWLSGWLIALRGFSTYRWTPSDSSRPSDRNSSPSGAESGRPPPR